MKHLLTTIVLFCIVLATQGQNPEIVLTGPTGAVIDQLEQAADNLLAKARDAGDYLLASAAVKMRDAMDAWKSANTELLNTAFEKLDNTSRETFARINRVVSDADAALKNRLQTIQESMENANQLVESIPTSGRPTYVLRYEPRIVPPNAAGKILVRVRGVNLDRGNPNIQLSTGPATRDLVGPLEVMFTIPTSEVPADEGSMEVRTLSLAYNSSAKSMLKRLFGKREEMTRQIPLIVLPKRLGEFNLTTRREIEKREEDSVPLDLGQFKGKNERVQKIVNPPGFEQGWRWDLSDKSKFSVAQGDGEAGRFEHIDWNGSSPNGIVVVAHCDQIKTLTRVGPGYVNLSFRGLRHRMVKSEVDGTPRAGTFTWNSDEAIPLDSGVKTITLKVKTFDRRERIFSGTGDDKFFKVDKEPSRLLIRPKVPEDIIKM